MSHTSAPSSSSGSPRSLFRTPPICPDPSCNRSATRDTSHRRGSYGRPYYYCQTGHPREFISWDDNDGIVQGNPPCKCGHLSRREQQVVPIPKAWYRCATRECNFWENIIQDDGPNVRRAASPEAGSGRQTTCVTPSPPRYQDGSNDTPIKYIVPGVTMTQSNLPSELSSLAISNKCPIHGLGKKRLFRSNRCKC